MSKSKIFLIIGIIMLVCMSWFVFYALHHPERSFSVSLKITYLIYVIYLLTMILMFVLAVLYKNR